MKQLKLALIGCGDRGSCYMHYLDENSDKFKLVAIADPMPEKRQYFVDNYGVSEEYCFDSYEELLAKDKFADIVMICTQDKLHYGPAMLAIEKGYDILLEKPISPDPKECFDLAAAATEKGVKVLVCHVLRYTPFYKTIKNFIDDGKLGRLMNINHVENVGNVHMSHSYVRGPWRRKDEAAPMILAKCCHDTDLLQWFVGDKKCLKVHSFGDQSYFNASNAPEGAPDRCLDGCPHKDTCYYYAPKVYKLPTIEVQHFKAVVAGHFNPTPEEVDKALETSPYGRCVFKCDNDVVDHQVASFTFEGGIQATLTMSAFNKGGRVTTFMGTKGEIRADLEGHFVDFYSFDTMETERIYDHTMEEETGGHGGGDLGIMEDLYDYVANDSPSNSISDITVSSMSYLMCFAAELSREACNVVDMAEYVEYLKNKNK